MAELWVRTLPYIVNQAVRKPWLQSFGTPGRGLLNLLVATRHCEATNPRDKRFAILPLLSLEIGRLAGRSADKQRLGNLRDAVKLGTHGQNDEKRGADNGLATKIVSYTNTPAHIFAKLAVYLLGTLGLEVLHEVIGPLSLLGLRSWAPDRTMVPTYIPKQTNLQAMEFYAGFRSNPWSENYVKPAERR